MELFGAIVSLLAMVITTGIAVYVKNEADVLREERNKRLMRRVRLEQLRARSQHKRGSR